MAATETHTDLSQVAARQFVLWWGTSSVRAFRIALPLGSVKHGFLRHLLRSYCAVANRKPCENSVNMEERLRMQPAPLLVGRGEAALSRSGKGSSLRINASFISLTAGQERREGSG